MSTDPRRTTYAVPVTPTRRPADTDEPWTRWNIAAGLDQLLGHITPWWHTLAACRDEDPNIFFPDASRGRAVTAYRTARTICHDCPVTDECLAWAMTFPEREGVWGATSPRQRENLRNGVVR